MKDKNPLAALRQRIVGLIRDEQKARHTESVVLWQKRLDAFDEVVKKAKLYDAQQKEVTNG